MSKFSRKCDISRTGIITHLPQSIIEMILTKLPIRDAVRTSILSTNWRSKWTTLTQLVFDDDGMGLHGYGKIYEEKIVNFIMRFLLLHDGPIHKFVISSMQLKMSPDIDQWLLFLSRKDIKELKLELDWYDYTSNAPSRIFSFQKLTSLALYGFELDPPSGFKGFPCLKNLVLASCERTTVTVIENLISSSPLLESFKIENVYEMALTVRAPNLKYLTLDGCFIDVCLYTPHLNLIALNARFFAVEVFLVTGEVPITYDYLKLINVDGINFLEIGHVLYFLRLLLKSPNLDQISVMANNIPLGEDTNFDFWEKEYPSDFTFKQLKVVKISGAYGMPQEMAFLKFLLGHSPMLEELSISPAHSKNVKVRQKMDMLIQLVQFQRVSAKAEIKFIETET